MAGTPAYAFYGHHKCATMWLNTLCAAVCQRLGLRYAAVYNEDQFGRDLPGWAAREGVHFLGYGNADLNFTSALPPHRGFHIIRDPRDIVVSAYFSHLKTHATGEWPELVAHRARLQSLSVEEGLLEEIRFRERSFRHMADWDYGQPEVLEIRFEDVTNRSYETLLAVFEHLGLLETRDYRFVQYQQLHSKNTKNGFQKTLLRIIIDPCSYTVVAYYRKSQNIYDPLSVN